MTSESPEGGDPGWRVLLIGGSSAAGKTTLARTLGLSLGLPWMQADDIRLAFSWVSFARTDVIYKEMSFFDHTPDAWRSHEPEELRAAYVAAGEALRVPLEAVIGNHVDHDHPLVIEGDGILPSLCAYRRVAERSAAVRAIFLVEPDEDALLANLRQRGRNTGGYSDGELRVAARAKWLFGQWIAAEAARLGLPVVEPRPFDTLLERVRERLDL